MLKFGFKDYEGFKEIFGLKEGAGGTYRPNKILLAFLKSKDMLAYEGAWSIKNMAQLFTFVDERVTSSKNTYGVADRFSKEDKPCGWVYIGNWASFASDKYYSDDQKGVCEDGDKRSFRYVLIENERTYKMKFGKMLNHLITLTDFGSKLPEQVRLWYIEERCRLWETYCASLMPDYDFHYGDGKELENIYNRNLQIGDFHSCMNSSDGFHGKFYRFSCENVKAAYLTRKSDGKMIARCIVFEECEDMKTGEIVRLAERQYSSDLNELLKRCLVDELIKRNLIDGYKRVGADCHSPRNFVSNDGADWSDRDFKIKCTVDSGDVNAYMDTFKWYNYNKSECYNSSDFSYDYELEETGDYWNTNEDRNYDDYYEEYTDDDLERAYRDGTEYYIAQWRTDSDDWVWCDKEGYYAWYTNVETCPKCGRTYDSYRHGLSSDLTDEEYCCSDCLEEAEDEYKEDNWYYAEYDNEYFEDAEDVVDVIGSDGDCTTIYIETLAKLIERGRAVLNDNDDYVLC